MKIGDNSCSLEINIRGYQFEDERSKDGEYNYDANWLICDLKFKDCKLEEEYAEPCILAVELEELKNAAFKIYNGETVGYISDFIEPNLVISMSGNGDIFNINVVFVYDMTDGYWKRHHATSFYDREGFKNIVDELEKLVKKFRER